MKKYEKMIDNIFNENKLNIKWQYDPNEIVDNR